MNQTLRNAADQAAREVLRLRAREMNGYNARTRATIDHEMAMARRQVYLDAGYTVCGVELGIDSDHCENLVAPGFAHCPEHAEKNIPCSRCAGTGMFITGTVNGQPVGPGGPCYRCGGKGFQTRDDLARNWGYDNFFAKVF